MDAPRILALMDEYNLGVDDVRWYLSRTLGRQLLEYRDHYEDLVQEIWSGRLADSMYNMEERWILQLEAEYTADIKDEAHVRGVLLEVKSAQRRRPRPF